MSEIPPQEKAEEKPSEVIGLKTGEDEQNYNAIPQAMDKPCGCATKGERSLDESMSTPYVYAIGKIVPRFPSPSLEKEYLQAVGRHDTKGQTDLEAMRTALSKRENRYIVREMCFVLTIEGLEIYIVTPKDPGDFELLVEALRAPSRGTDINVVVGTRGPISRPEDCNGLMLPIVVFDQVYSFDVDTLLKAIPKPAKFEAKKFNAVSEELLYRIMQMADNVGGTDEHRALNYLAVRYDAIYANMAEMQLERNFYLDSVEVRPSRLSGTKKIRDVIFAHRNRDTDVIEKYFVRVDVTGKYPYLVNKLSNYYDR